MSRSKNARETDVLGKELFLDRSFSRIVSLVPSLTETLFELGIGDRVVGVTDFCIFPEIPPGIRRIGGTKNPDIETIRGLAPDLVYVNVEENLRRHAEAIEAFSSVFATEPQSVIQVRDLIGQLGRIHDREDRAGVWVSRLDSVIAEVDEPRREFTFVCPIWKGPWMWCGGDTYVADLVSTAGGRNLIGDRERYPRMALDEVVALDPDVVFLPDEPYEFGESDAAELRDVFRGRVVGPFPGHLFTWHGTRTVAGLSFLANFVRTLPDTAVVSGASGTDPERSE